MINNKKTGKLTVYAAPMFGGKTTSLIAELENSIEENKKAIVVKPTIDKRYSIDDIVSHDGTSLKKLTGHSVRLLDVNDVLSNEDLEGIDIVLIDEAQFFTNLCNNSILNYLEKGIDVVAVGLDLDSNGVPFGSMPFLLSIADVVYKLSGICSVCGEDATRTFRKLSASSTDQVLIGGKETYEPRCLQHWLEGEKEKKSWLS